MSRRSPQGEGWVAVLVNRKGEGAVHDYGRRSSSTTCNRRSVTDDVWRLRVMAVYQYRATSPVPSGLRSLDKLGMTKGQAQGRLFDKLGMIKKRDGDGERESRCKS